MVHGMTQCAWRRHHTHALAPGLHDLRQLWTVVWEGAGTRCIKQAWPKAYHML